MDVLVVGSGGREHALCRAFRRSPKVGKLFCANGNAGIALDAECVAIPPDDIGALADFASANNIGLTFVGGEVPLALGIGDEFLSRGLRVVAPTREAAQLESSKAFAKEFMARNGVPTAKFSIAHSPGFAVLELEGGEFGKKPSPIVVKADGLAAGKGVVVAKDHAEAITAINEMSALVGTAAADKIVLEECLIGKEISLLAFVDGENFALMPAVRDHKRIGERDTGPNTGGMGTFTDSTLLTSDQIQEISDKILRPTLHGCIREEFPFRGILFLGLMMTASGPMLLEYNVRFGDPETQAILVRLETDLVNICEAMIDGQLASTPIEWRPGSSACVVLASEGYPGKPRTGDVIDGAQDMPAGVEVFHAGTALNADGRFITSGGRVLGVTATGSDLDTALEAVYSGVERISWTGMQYRRDIGR